MSAEFPELLLPRAERKRFSTLLAQALLMPDIPVRLVAIVGDNGRPEFIVWRDAQTTRCRDLDELERVLPDYGVQPRTFEQLEAVARAGTH